MSITFFVTCALDKNKRTELKKSQQRKRKFERTNSKTIPGKNFKKTHHDLYRSLLKNSYSEQMFSLYLRK